MRWSELMAYHREAVRIGKALGIPMVNSTAEGS